MPDIQPSVQVDKALYDSVNNLRNIVAMRKIGLDDAIAAKKLAQTQHDDARTAFERAVDRMVNETEGRPELPLFANMSDAIAAATSDPIVDTILQRLIAANVTHLNILIVAGWNDAERAQALAYLDSFEARLAAWKAQKVDDPPVELPVVLDLPAFLVVQPDAPEAPAEAQPTDAEVVEALAWCDVELTAAQISRMTTAHRYTVLTWAHRVKHVKAEKGDALTMDDLPAAPSFVLNPAELDLDTQLDVNADTPKKTDTKKPKGKRKKKGGGK